MTDVKMLTVYKVFCFDGEPHLIQTIQNDKTAEETIDYFDKEWNLLNIRQNYPNSEIPTTKPKALEQMLQAAAKLSAGFPFLRVDFYEIDNEPYFSEFTFYSDAGMAPFHPAEWDHKLGERIRLPI